MINEIIIDGIEYKLVRKIPKPKFKLDDAVEFINNTEKTKPIFRISQICSDRYYLDGGENYFQFINQENYKLVGKFQFQFVEKKKNETIN